jgi:hypothetical protein
VVYKAAMIGEINILGVFVPAVLVLMLIAYVIKRVLVMLLGMTGIYRFVWHRAMFDLCLYIFIFGAIVALSRRYIA